jgi:hypothetical protein
MAAADSRSHRRMWCRQWEEQAAGTTTAIRGPELPPAQPSSALTITFGLKVHIEFSAPISSSEY